MFSKTRFKLKEFFKITIKYALNVPLSLLELNFSKTKLYLMHLNMSLNFILAFSTLIQINTHYSPTPRGYNLGFSPSNEILIINLESSFKSLSWKTQQALINSHYNFFILFIYLFIY